MLAAMTSQELTLWQAYFALRRDEADAEQNITRI